MTKSCSVRWSAILYCVGGVLIWYDALCSVYVYRSANSIGRCFTKQTMNILKVKGTQICQLKASTTLVFSKSSKQPPHTDQMWLRQIKLNQAKIKIDTLPI